MHLFSAYDCTYSGSEGQLTKYIAVNSQAFVGRRKKTAIQVPSCSICN